MKPIDKTGPNAVTPRVTVAAPVSRAAAVRPVQGPATDGAASVALSSLAAGDAPSDPARVQEIRKAIDEGRYPLFPARIADAMVAAGYLLRIKS